MSFEVITRYPLAVDSPDFTHPYGTINDNSGGMAFLEKLCALSVESLLDIGCAGGLLVRQANELGIKAVGLEGSDNNKLADRHEWPVCDRLLTCDITKPFKILYDRSLFKFDCVTAWEVMEHIRKCDLPALFENVRTHTHKGSLFVCSISCGSSPEHGVEHHQTIESSEFWDRKFQDNDWERSEGMERTIAPSWVRTGTFNRVYISR